MGFLALVVGTGWLFPAWAAIAQSTPPGVVIDHWSANTGQYVGSPSIAVLPDGAYVASHDLFGPASDRRTTLVFISRDRGASWSPQGRIDGQWWSSLFVLDGALYIIGPNREFGQLVIRRSTDEGRTWTDPTDPTTGLLASGKYHCAPTPVVEYRGLIWRAFGDENGRRLFMVSAPADANLLYADNWTRTGALVVSKQWLGGKVDDLEEGNCVVAPDGQVVDVLRVDGSPPGGEKAAIVHFSGDYRQAIFDPDSDFVDFPGGHKKFTIRFDPVSQRYWSLVNWIPPQFAGGNVNLTRNTLALVQSRDLRTWTIRCVVLQHPDRGHHAFQYADWLFDGDDLIAVSRTAYDDDSGGANSAHNANYLTFHRIRHFRDLTMKDSVSAGQPAAIQFSNGDLKLCGNQFEIATLNTNSQAFNNRNYVWDSIPDRFIGWKYTRSSGGVRAEIQVTAIHDTILYAATAEIQTGIDTVGWEKMPGVFLRYTDRHRTTLSVFSRKLKAGDVLQVAQGNWSGMIVLLPPAN